MPQPYNYSVDVQSPFESVVSGLKLGATINDLNVKNYTRNVELQRQADIDASLKSLINNPNPTARDFANHAALLPEKEAENFRNSWKYLNESQQNSELKFGSQVMSAFSSGNNNVGVQLLEERAKAEENSGNPQNAKAFGVYAQIAKENPKAATTMIGTLMAAIPGGDKALSSIFDAQKQPSSILSAQAEAEKKQLEAANAPLAIKMQNQKALAETRNIQSQIDERASRLRLDQNRLESDVNLKLTELNQKAVALDPAAQKLANEAVINATSSEQSANNMDSLASQIESAGGGSGMFTKASEILARATGNQDEWSNLRNQYIQMRNSQAIKSLPPGAASDYDVKIALSGMPDEYAPASTIASFLRGMSKIRRFESQSSSAQAEWISQAGGLFAPKTDITIGGVRVPAGTTFVDFQRKFGGNRATEITPNQSQGGVMNRDYFKKFGVTIAPTSK